MVDGKHNEKRIKKIRRLDIKAGLLGFFMFCRFWTQRVSRNGVASGGRQWISVVDQDALRNGFLVRYIYIRKQRIAGKISCMFLCERENLRVKNT
jgi:hypothetical protein